MSSPWPDLFSRFLLQKKLLGFLFLLIFAGITVATLWPFNFNPANGVAWIPGKNGVHFSRAGVLISTSPFAVPTSSANNSVTLEFWLRSDEIWSRRAILGFYDPSGARQLVISQWDGGPFIWRERPSNSGRAITEEIRKNNLFQIGQPMLLTIASSPAGTVVYVNAVQVQVFPHFHIRTADLSGRLVVGTAPDSFRPWRGDIYLISLYASALSPQEIRLHYESLSSQSAAFPETQSLLAQYSFSESSGRIARSSVPSAPDLQMPEKFFLPNEPFLESPANEFRNTPTYYHDLLVNVVGFLPYGFLLCAYLANSRFARFAVLYSFFSGAAFSFLIEVTQGFIPQRGSGLTDVITNSLGALLGALLLLGLRRRNLSS